MELELFEKTEIWIKPIKITKVNLDLIAEKVAEVLNFKKSDVMVVDVRQDLVTLDLMKRTIRAEDLIGKKEVLLKALATIPGVSITPGDDTPL